MTASEILVVILSIVLAVFLILAIVLTIYLIVIARKIRTVADTAERTANQFAGIAGFMRRAAAPAVISKLALDVFERFMSKRRKKSRKGDSDD